MPSINNSTPLRPSSRHVESDSHNTPPASQENLKDILGNELENHTWHFSSDRVARMLSAKTRKTSLVSGEKDALENYDCDVDKLVPALDAAYASLTKDGLQQPWPAASGEREHYTHLANFLNQCVKVCHDALDTCEFKVKKADRWYSNLCFVKYDKPTKDGIGGAAAVKPDLAGGPDLKDGESLYWSPRNESDKPIYLPVEVKDGWPGLVRQAATYACCLFSASPLRQYALVLGIEHVKKEFRFLIFHRGGLSASMSLSMEGDSHKDILLLFLAILTWKSAEDAGFAEWCNDVEFCLPRDEEDKDGVLARVDEVLHSSLCVRGCATGVSRISYPVNSPPPSSTVQPSHHSVAALAPKTQQRCSARLLAVQAEEKPATASETRGGSGGGTKLGSRKNPTSSKNPSSGAAKKASTDEKDTENPIDVAISRCQQRQVKFVKQALHFTGPLNRVPDKESDRIEAVVKCSWPSDDGNGIEAELLQRCSGQFGTPMHHYSFQACKGNGQPISNNLFLPDESERQKVHWKLFNHDADAAPLPEHRSLWVHVSAFIGKSLVSAETPWALFQALAHAMLGWLSMCQLDFLHRDISIGNVLMVDKPITMTKFHIDQQDMEVALRALSLEDAPTIKKLTKELAELINDLDISEKCLGFVIDGDMAINWKTYFKSSHDDSRSGTLEFMSDPLLRSLQFSSPYLQSSIDDLFSFYYVGQWAAVFNISDLGDTGQTLSPQFEHLRRLVAGDVDARVSAVVRIGGLSSKYKELYSPFLVRCAPVFEEWFLSVSKIYEIWDAIEHPEGLDQNSEKAYNFYIPYFRAFAYKGVKEYLQILKKHRTDLMKPLKPL